MKKIFTVIFLVLFSVVSYSQTGTLRGFVYNTSNGEPVMFANIIVENTNLGTVTDNVGFFVFNKVPAGEKRIKIQSLGFSDTTITVNIIADKIQNVKINITPQAQQLETVDIFGQQEVARTESRVSVKKITYEDIVKIPSVGGQADIAQYIQVLPGVVFSGDQGGQLYIRGGSAIQNKVLLDGMVVYNPFHSIGLFSVFETDIIRNADIYTGGFNAQYGGRISSVMDISTKDGNKKKTSGKLSLSTFGASAILEGPIIADNGTRDYSLSYILAAKNSYLSKTSKSIYSYLDSELPYDFFDIYAKMTLAANNGSKISLFGFNFTDNVKSYKNIADFSWRNSGMGTNITLIPANSPSIVKVLLSYSDYSMKMDEHSTTSHQQSSISSFEANIDAVRFFDKNQLRYGVEAFANTTETQYGSMSSADPDYSTDLGAYVVFKGFLGKFLYEPGIRLSYYPSIAETVLEPRLTMKLNLTDKFRLKAALGHYSQTFLDTKSDRDIVNLFTGYLTASQDLPGGVVNTYHNEPVTSFVETSDHYIFGIEYDATKRLSFNLEVYYKNMFNLFTANRDKLFDAKDKDHEDQPDYLRKDFALENAYSYGGDISVKYADGRLYVWGIYSYGKVEKDGETITYNPHYDRRHNVNILVSYQFGMDRSWELGCRWNYGSGFPFTATAGFGETLALTESLNPDYITPNGNLTTFYGQLNARRLPDYHRLDISIKKRFNVFKHSVLEFEGSVTNVYDRKNLFYYDRITNERVNQLPIMPSLGVTLKF